MKITDLPFLHYFVRLEERQSDLRCPMEVEETSCAGAFFAPVQRSGKLFANYRFHFSIYLGDGMFVEQERGKKALFTGFAASAQVERQDHLLLMFGVPGPEPWFFPHFFPPLPRLLEHEDEFFIPMLQRVPRKRSVKYGGLFSHRDFDLSFVELQPADPKVLDSILMHFRISLIGCDPHSKYEKRGGRSNQ